MPLIAGDTPHMFGIGSHVAFGAAVNVQWSSTVQLDAVGMAIWAHVCGAATHAAGVKVQWFASRHASAVAAVVAQVCAADVHVASFAPREVSGVKRQ